MDVKYTHVITRFYPQSQHYAIGQRYEDIVWIHNPVSKEELDLRMLDVAKDMRAEDVRQDSIFLRSIATRLVIGTDDPFMLRTYDEKRKEAERFVRTNPYPETAQGSYPALKGEAALTGTTVGELAVAVLEQYEMTSRELNPFLGEIEGTRRMKMAEIYDAVDMDALNDVGAPEWPDVSKLKTI